MRNCDLCKSDQRDDVKYGEFLTRRDINMSVHTYCLYLTSNLAQRGDDDEGFLGFLPVDIKLECKRISRLNCCYCNKPYANIGCCAPKCRRTFHTICGVENGVENQFKGTYQSFCDQHVSKVKYRPSHDELCSICFDSLWLDMNGNGKEKRARRFSKVNMLRAPCCRNGWFHKLCLQKFARTAGYFFKCPLCNDKEMFCEKLAYSGIFIPSRDAAWELEPNAFSELLERPNCCVAVKCLNKGGRKKKSERNPLLLCATCGSVAIHQLCKSTKNRSFNCDDCQRHLNVANRRESLYQSQQQNNETSIAVDDDDDEKEVEVDVCILSDSESNIDVDAAVEANVKEDFVIESGNEVHNPTTSERLKHVTLRRKYNIRHIPDDSDDEDDKNVKAEVKSETNNVHLFNKEIQKDELIVKSVNLYQATDTNFIISDNDDSSSNTDDNEDEYDIHKSRVQSLALSQRLRSITAGSASEHANNGVESTFSARTSTACNKPTLVSATLSKHITTKETINHSISSSDDDTDDPLQNPFVFLKQKQNSQSVEPLPIANCLRRKSLHCSSEISGSAATSPLTRVRKLSTQNQTGALETSSNDTHKSTKELENVKEVKEEERHALEISCIASRTRRKSSVVGNEKTAAAIKLEHPPVSNILDISCIAMRTRRKSFHVASPSNSETENNQKYSIKNEDDSRPDSVSSFHSAISYASSKEHNAADILEISCIGNRTRQRKSLGLLRKSKSPSITKTTSTLPSSSSLSSNSGSFSSASSASFDSTISTTTETFHSLHSSNSELSCSSGTYRASSSSSSSDLNKRCKVLLKRSASHNSSNSCKSKRIRQLSSNDADDDDDDDDYDAYDCDATPNFTKTSLSSYSADSASASSNSTYDAKLQRRSRTAAKFNISQQQSRFDAYITPTFTRIDGKLKRDPINIASMREKADNSVGSPAKSSSSLNYYWKNYEFLTHRGNSGSSSSDENSQRTSIQRSRGSHGSSNHHYRRSRSKVL